MRSGCISGGIRKDGGAARTQVRVRAIELVVIERREIIHNLHAPAVLILIGGTVVDGVIPDLQEAVAVVAVDGKAIGVQADGLAGAIDVAVKSSIPGFKIEETLRIERGDTAALPDAAQAPVGRRVERAGESKRGGV